MTEAEWDSTPDSLSLFRWVAATASQRKFRLYLCGGCRHIKHLFFHSSSMDAVEMAEKFVDGFANETDFGKAAWAAEVPTFGYHFEEEYCEIDPEHFSDFLPRLVALGSLSESVLIGGVWQVNEAVRERLLAAAVIAERCALSWVSSHENLFKSMSKVEWPGRWLVDCVFGNPFRPVSVDPVWLAWNDGTVANIAREIDEEQRFEALPILPDALEDAGCGNADILMHCRSQKDHVRGCWVIDLLLNKALVAEPFA